MNDRYLYELAKNIYLCGYMRKHITFATAMSTVGVYPR